MTKRRIIAAENADKLNEIAGDILVDITGKAIAERGRAVILVSGGTSVWAPYAAFGRSTVVDWSKVYIFWGDDRFVEPENPYSNYAMVRDSLLANAHGLPAENVFPIDVQVATPAKCAEQYASTIQQFFNLSEGEWPIFDLAQNGMGPDGHTASLFPHTPEALVDDRICVMNHAGFKPWVDRITLTLPVFNHARFVLFIASGKAKSATLKKVLEGSPTRFEAPSAHVQPEDGTALWLVDRAAASELTSGVESDY